MKQGEDSRDKQIQPQQLFLPEGPVSVAEIFQGVDSHTPVTMNPKTSIPVVDQLLGSHMEFLLP